MAVQGTPPSLPPRQNHSNHNTYAPLASSTYDDQITDDSVKDAFDVLDSQDRSLDDQTLIGLYNIRVSDNPIDREKARNALNVIGISRNSSLIREFLENEEDNRLGISGMDVFSQMPVGLDNIGNTCYLNSLLQYYFTIRDLREAVLKTDSMSNYDVEKDWQNEPIGGRKITKLELDRAEKFVNLLRKLFLCLMTTSDKSIAPDVELAYLALVNAKSDEEAMPPKVPLAESTKTQNSNLPVGDPSAGPSSVKITDPNLASDLSSDFSTEYETVEMEGVAGIIGTDILGSGGKRDTTQGGFLPQNDENDPKNSSLPNDKGKGKENDENLAPPGSDYDTPSKKDTFDPRNISFGKQQDVTECMDNVMFLLEAALKPIINEQTNIVKSDGYIVVVEEGKDLYDGLDVYFDESQVEFEGTQAERKVTITELPPILQIQIQRVQFDRSTSNVYKSNAYIRFDKVIYLDRYMDEHREGLLIRRRRARQLNDQIAECSNIISENSNKETNLLTNEMLQRTVEFIRSQQTDSNYFPTSEDFDVDLLEISNESARIQARLDDAQSKMKSLQDELRHQYDDLTKFEYRIHAVFIHNGQADFGHYLIYIYDFEGDRWLKYNDAFVTEVNEYEVFQDTTGSSANPYCMVYVRAQDCKRLVETICRKFA